MKLPIKILGGVVALFIVTLLVVYFSLNIIVTRLITSFGPALTQTPVKVTLVTISPFSGGGRVVGLSVDSTKDYTAQPALKFHDVTFKINLPSLLTDRVIVEDVSIDAPEVNFEQKFSSNNISALRQNVNAYASKLGGSSAPGSASSSKSARKIQINHLSITNGKVHISTGGATVTFPIADIDQRDIGTKSDGITSAEMTRIVFSAFTNSILKGVASGALLKEGAGSIGEGVKRLFGN